MTNPIQTRGVRALLLASAAALALEGRAFAQDADTPDAGDDEVVAVGTIQQTIEQSIDFKRNQSVVSDALIGAELGDLPDLSVAESLERIVGVTSDRFKGGASEVSIRGLGAFLGASTLNGREITSGSDGRDVNFGQFPSELVNGALVYKSQQASFVEGGISGIIELQTLRPLDYGKRRIQLQGLLGYSDYEDRVRDGDPFNERITASYIDQFELGGGDIGISIGGQLRRDTAPEDIYATSSSFNVCSTVSNGSGGNCSYSAANSNDFGVDGAYFTSNQYIYRAYATEADRDAIMGNIQWQPNDRLDINLDAQWSDRSDVEDRANLVIADGRRRITPIQVADSGALLAWQGNSRLENQSVYRTRDEEYVGFGANVAYTSGLWTVAGDVGYSETERFQDELDMRIRTNRRVDYRMDTRDLDIPQLTLLDVSEVESNTGLDFDLDNHDIYTNGARARRRLELNTDEIVSARLDFTRELPTDSLGKSLKFGARISERKRFGDDGIDSEQSRGVNRFAIVNGYDSEAVRATRLSDFIVDDIYQGADAGVTDPAQGLYGQGLTFANWDSRALFAALTGDPDAGLPLDGQSTLDTSDTDITERVYAGYLQADFEAGLGDTPVYGNVGARIVHTQIDSTGFITDFTTSVNDNNPDNFDLDVVDGSARAGTESNSFTNVLPSANIVFELAEDKLLRFAAYSAIARPDARDLTAALVTDSDPDGFSDVGDAIRAIGSPGLEVLRSNNLDASVEWYPREDSILSLAGYYKSLKTGFENATDTVVINVDGVDQGATISRTVNNNDTSDLFGFEIAVQHKFSDLGGFLGGFGIQAAYNFADSDFEFPDPIIQRGIPIADFTDPANISGYSKHSGNATVFWEDDDVSVRLAYKARSQYYKPFRVSQLRFTEAQDFLDASMSYDITDNLEVRAQALNLTNEPNIFYRPVRDSLAQADYSGRRYFVGLRARF